MEDLGLKIEVEGLWIEDMKQRFEDFIMLHQHLIHMCLVIYYRKSRYFGNIVKR